jgi:hypothetical protein
MLVTLTTTPLEIEAQLLKGRLAAAGIESYLSSKGGATDGVRVEVEATALAAAQAVLSRRPTRRAPGRISDLQFGCQLGLAGGGAYEVACLARDQWALPPLWIGLPLFFALGALVVKYR